MKSKQHQELFDLLEQKYLTFSQADFIENDPILIPHRFSAKEDIEIAAFLSATIAWGNRKSIINNANKMMHLLDHSPYEFIMNHQDEDLKKLKPFVHRTFNGTDFITFIKALQHIYKNHNGLEAVFSKHISGSQALHFCNHSPPPG